MVYLFTHHLDFSVSLSLNTSSLRGRERERDEHIRERRGRDDRATMCGDQCAQRGAKTKGGTFYIYDKIQSDPEGFFTAAPDLSSQIHRFTQNYDTFSLLGQTRYPFIDY